MKNRRSGDVDLQYLHKLTAGLIKPSAFYINSCLVELKVLTFEGLKPAVFSGNMAV